MSCAYVLHSANADKYYVGSTSEPIEVRVQRHNSDYYDNKYTAKGKPWEPFLVINCEAIEQARKIERHIKSMKSRKYIENLKVYPEMVEKLLSKCK